MSNPSKSLYAAAVTLGLVFLGALSSFTYFALSPPQPLVKIPILNNVFIAKDAEDSGEILFNAYLAYMRERGFRYLPEERAGGVIWFEKNGEKFDMSYPKFARLR